MKPILGIQQYSFFETGKEKKRYRDCNFFFTTLKQSEVNEVLYINFDMTSRIKIRAKNVHMQRMSFGQK